MNLKSSKANFMNLPLYVFDVDYVAKSDLSYLLPFSSKKWTKLPVKKVTLVKTKFLPFMGFLFDFVVGIPTLTVVTVYSTLRFPKLWHSSGIKSQRINEQFIALLVVTETFVEAHLWLEEETF